MPRLTLTLILGCAVAMVLPAQNLLRENPHYQEAQELRRQAEQAIDNGNYAEAEELAQQAAEAAAEAEEWANTRVRQFRANGWINVANIRVEEARSFDAPDRYPDEWENAQEFFSSAQSLYEEGNYDQSIQASRNVIAALENVQPPSGSSTAQEQDTQSQEEDTLPRYYEVRLIPENRDSFWKIAGYPFVYDDPWQWRRLYEANRDKLADPDNPDLIHPGQRFVIPSIEGEERSGTWDPSSGNQ